MLLFCFFPNRDEIITPLCSVCAELNCKTIQVSSVMWMCVVCELLHALDTYVVVRFLAVRIGLHSMFNGAKIMGNGSRIIHCNCKNLKRRELSKLFSFIFKVIVISCLVKLCFHIFPV